MAKAGQTKVRNHSQQYETAILDEFDMMIHKLRILRRVETTKTAADVEMNLALIKALQGLKNKITTDLKTGEWVQREVQEKNNDMFGAGTIRDTKGGAEQ